MPIFDSSEAYQAKQEVFFDDGREIALLHSIYRSPSLPSLRNNPAGILAFIDTYARTEKYLMNVGHLKGRIVTDLIASVRPHTMVELGGYIGYSCILFGDAVRRAGGKRYFSLERNAEFAAVSASLVDLAGLEDVVKVVVGASGEGLRRLKREMGVERVDLMFLDHYKPAYTEDLKLCEELGLVGVGSVLAADNVVTPGNPPYLEYVRSSVAEKRRRLEAGEGVKGGVDERFAERTSKQYAQREGEAKLDGSVKGNPNLVYESKLMDSFEPTGEKDGVEITRCTGEES